MPETDPQCQLKEKGHFFLFLHKIPVNNNANFNTIFMFIKSRVHKTQTKFRCSHLVLKAINTFRQVINAAITIIFCM